MMINKETKEWAPVPRFLNVPQLVEDIKKVTDAARGKKFSNFMMAHGDAEELQPVPGAAEPSGSSDLLKKFDKTLGAYEGQRREVRHGRTRSAPTKTP